MFAQTTEITTYDLPNYEITTVDSGSILLFSGVYLLFWLVILVLSIIGMWKIFEKADEQGWIAIVPFYNTYTLLRVAGRNGWWLLAMFVPLVNIVVMIIVSIDLAKHFGKSTGFAIGLIFLPFIFYLILGFGDAKYVGPKHA